MSRWERSVSTIVSVLLISSFPLISSPVHAAVTTTTYSYTGSATTFTVPAGITTLKFRVIGASGGSAWGVRGGFGESLTGTLTVTPGEILQLNVGQVGANHAGGSSSGRTSFNGGGSGFYYAAGGGGASDIRRGSFASSDRLVVAGGGAGNGIGGDAGFTTGVTGTDSGLGVGGSLNGGGGAGGTQSGGGAGGVGAPSCGSTAGGNGSLAQGGNGAASSSGGGGGGGGYFGGGGGGSGCNSSSGGGGSSYANPTLTSSVLSSVMNIAGAGSITITYGVISPISISLTSVNGETTAIFRTIISLRAVVDAPGKITFFVDGKRISGCISRPVTTSIDCAWKPSRRGTFQIKAYIQPANSGDIENTSSTMNFLVGNKTIKR